MTTRPTKAVINCTTGVETIVELTDEEIAEFAALAKADAENKAIAEAEAERVATLKTSAKAKLVSGQALTEEEASVLVM